MIVAREGAVALASYRRSSAAAPHPSPSHTLVHALVPATTDVHCSFHVDAEAGGARTWKTSNLFSVVHKTQITAIGSVKKLPIVKLWHEGDQQWLFIHDSLVHLDPRLGMCGSARNSAGASYFKVIFVKRGAKIREELASKLNFERNPMAAARTSARS